MPEAPKPKKQAVIVVHGMGEQRPMQTLRSFVASLYWKPPAPSAKDARWRQRMRRNIESIANSALGGSPPADSEDYWIVPDARTGSSELSRIRGKPQQNGAGGLETDFYELYYSDLLTGNTLQHLWAWFRGLLLRWPHQVPKSQGWLWVMLWVATILIALLLGSELANAPLRRLQEAWLAAAHLEAWWTRVSSALGALVLIWLMSSAYRKHVDEKNTKPAEGVIHRFFSAALCLLLPAALGFWAYKQLPWAFFAIPKELLETMADRHPLFQAYLLVTGWSMLKMALAGLIVYLVVKMGVPVFGDVARYLRTAPDGVAARSQIRERGLNLLETVHDAKVLAEGAGAGPAREYERVVIVAHSLGSIVAFDVLRMFWAKRGANGGKRLSPGALAGLEEVDEFCRSNPSGSPQMPEWPLEDYIRIQNKAAAEIARQEEGWRVSDFITLGSPLAHAEFLLSRDRPRFEALIRERVFPTCPPQLEHRSPSAGVASFLYMSAIDGNKWPHHAAMFAPMRWTALFDPARGIFFGDFIGGKLRRNFGPAIAEAHTKLSKPGLLQRVVTHTHYWNPNASCELLNETELPHDIRPGPSEKPHLELLKRIIFRAPASVDAAQVKSPSGPAPARPAQARSQGRGSQRAGKTSRPS